MISELPTLEDILSRKTLPPVCLYNFYIVMRDKLNMDDLLDFYLDVRHHEILWRRYVKSILKYGIISADDDLLNGLHSIQILQQQQQQQETPSLTSGSSSTDDEPIEKYTDITSSIHKTPTTVATPTTVPPPPPQHHLMMMGERKRSSDDISISVPLPIVRPAVDDKGFSKFYYYGEHHKLPDRHDLTASTERIIHTYITPGGPKSLDMILPAKIRQVILETYLNLNGTVRHDPMLFAEAKHATFLYMERWAYPPFMRLKAWGNVTTKQCLYRLVIGLFSLVVGFTTALSFIFLDFPVWGVRFWSLLPFWIGCYQLFVFLSRLDPILALVFNISETTTFHFNKISQPQVKKILQARAFWLLIFNTLISVIITIILCAIPSTRF